VVAKAVEAVRGLSEFAAEQVVAMSLRKDEGDTDGRLDLDALWERKRVTIEQTRGLRVWRGKERFADLVGLDNVKASLMQQTEARTPVGVVVFLDEVDKVFANVEHDTSNVKMDQLRGLLTEMENNGWPGIVCVGVAGGGKSAIAKAFGNEAGVPTIALDLGDMEGPHVGESEAMFRHAIDVVKAIGSGNAFFIATSNQASVMRPELQRRFTEGVFFFDVMTEREREAAWAFYIKKYGLDDRTIPADDGWTGAEIRNCCRRAWNSRLSLVEAGRFIVPMARARADEIERLRQAAHERMLDATNSGMYRYEAAPMAKTLRAIALPGGLVPALDQMKES
jgi:SpoVK/Ycf46/Vps4 family AAA+-type ATPase